MRLIALALLVVLAACGPVVVAPQRPGTPQPQGAAPRVDAEIRARAERAARQFVNVVDRVEPVAEAECRRITPRQNCDFLIVVDDRPGQPPNAFQTLDRGGRPVIAFTLALIADAQNEDELAFILGHEAAHHIAGHIPRTQQNAAVGATILAGLIALGGGDAAAVQRGEQIGAVVGARTYSKEFELEADVLGTVIAKQAGYDPVRGAAYFERIPDPGDRFLGSHPPNAQREAIVRETAARL